MSDQAQITLPIALTIVEVESLRQEMLALAQADLTINAEAVDHVDSAGLQLLASACLTVAQNGHQVFWQGVTQSLADSVVQCGLKDLMQLPS